MSKLKIKNNNEGDEIKIKEAGSSLGEFVKRTLPSEKEAEKFDEYVQREAKEEEMDEGLAEIYQDESGKMTDVKRIEVKKRRGFFFWFFAGMVAVIILSGAVYAAYNYVYLRFGSNSDAIRLSIDGESEVMAGEEFFYSINYRNLSNVEIKNVEIKLIYPEGFIPLDSASRPSGEGGVWKFDSLAAHRSDSIKIKGKLIGQKDEKKVILAAMVYTPANFSSEFRKEAAFEKVIKNIGIDFSFAGDSSVLVGEENEIVVRHKKQDRNYLSNFRLTVEAPENVEIIRGAKAAMPPNIWENNEVVVDGKEISVKFRFKEKKADVQDLIFNFEHSDDGANFYKFFEGRISLEVVKNNLNLNLIANGSRNDQGVDFGQTLNFSVVYANKGEPEMKDVIIMAVLESGILDWGSLSDANKGKMSGNAISWSKQEIPALASLKQNDEGIIDFSVKILPFDKLAVGGELDMTKKYEVRSYAQFSIGQSAAGDGQRETTEDRRSNIIVNKINSDLRLKEEVRYFNEDNIAVGSGPLPPKVGEATSLKVYWKLTNNLHELTDLRVEVSLPAYVGWDNKSRAAVGTIEHDSVNHKVVWDIGRLPITVYETDAEFNISITPAEADRNKIVVLLPGTKVAAMDNETQSAIEKPMPAKTTKLEDDDIAESDGIVE